MFLRIGIVLTVMIVMINGSIPTSSVDEDAMELTKLHKKYLDLSPELPSGKFNEVRCRMVHECCPKLEHMFSMFSFSPLNEKCLVNSTKSKSCLSTIDELDKIKKDPMFTKYVKMYGSDDKLEVIDIKHRRSQKKGLMKMVCSEDELSAYYCERDNMEKLKSCYHKVLNFVSGEKLAFFNMTYDQFISQWKKDYITGNELLVKMFPKV